MTIKTLYTRYFQKSLVFIYPLLGIKKGVSVTPISTYVSWEGNYSLADLKLICTYHIRDDKEFRIFERINLMGNRLFHDFKLLEDGTGAYIFDISQYAEDYKNFVNGSYSKLSAVLKRKIEEYYGAKSANYAYVESYLEPQKYFGIYSEIIGVDENTLKMVGELCDKPDLVRENLVAKVKDLQIREGIT